MIRDTGQIMDDLIRISHRRIQFLKSKKLINLFTLSFVTYGTHSRNIY